MATQEEIRVGSIVLGPRRHALGVVVARSSRHQLLHGAADIYWFTKKRIVWEYISYLEVLVK